ncbi:MAG: hypothetical protein CBD16_06855 [Betaproteobacteria bacterium TMED156]|nr:MAG: hypothetical protein CBD16_06855 [Betaproteobacteria bacterium TMED156]
MDLIDETSRNSQVFARKWRPKKFSEVIGQEVTVRALKHSLISNSLHHAYLFTGNRGVGKTTMARIVAKAINCIRPQNDEPCTNCSTCKEIDHGKFVDVMEIDAASNRGVEEIQHILEQTQFSPTVGLKKVIVIDEVHMLSNHAFNAMLKTLEEPPDHVVFILATTDPQKLPTTVISRCLQFVLRNIPSKQIFDYLIHVLDVEKITFERKALIKISEVAEGSMRDALSIVDQAIACGQGKIEDKSVGEMLGLAHQDGINNLVRLIADSNIKDSLHQGCELINCGTSAKSILEELAKVFHKSTVLLALSDIGNIESDPSVDYLCKSTNLETLQLYYQVTLIGKRDLPLSPDEFIGLEMTLIRLFTFIPKSFKANKEYIKQNFSDNSRLKKTPVVDKKKSPTNILQNNPKKLDKKINIENWIELVEKFNVSGLLRQFFHQSKLIEVRNDKNTTLHFVLPTAVLTESSLLSKVENFLKNEFKKDNLVINVKVGESEKKNVFEINKEKIVIEKNYLKKKLGESQLVKGVMEHFGAEIDDDSITSINPETKRGN